MALYGNGENSQDLAVGTRYDPDGFGRETGENGSEYEREVASR